MKQRLQQADHPIIVELLARDASLADQRRLGQRQLAAADRSGEEVGPQPEGSVIGRSQPRV